MANVINRHNYRRIMIRTLYTIDFNKQLELDNDDLLSSLLFSSDCDDDNTLYEEYKETFDQMVQELDNILDKWDDINRLISKNLINYTIDRLNIVDRAIIRYAVYEMCYKDIPNNIVINEAILLTKEYSNLEDGKQSKFTNSVLDKINKGLSNE